MKITKYIAGIVSVLTFAGTFSVTTASAQILSASSSISVDVSANASTSMKGMHMPNGRMGSSTRISSTTREEIIAQRQDQSIGTIDTHSSTEISTRIGSLNSLLGRLNGMTKLSSSEKSGVSAEVQNLIAELTTLQAKIQTDASSTPTGQAGDLSSSSPLRMDMQSITKDYRVYALVIPQLEILAAADRAETIVTSLTTISTKLQTRISADQTAGDNVASLQAALSDLNAKTADAQTQAANAISSTGSLVPDQGNTTVAASNTAVLKAARTDIQTADSDIKAATADVQSIVKGVEAFGNVSASASSTQ